MEQHTPPPRPATGTSSALEQLAQMLDERDILAIIKALQIPLAAGYGQVEIELLDGRIRVARGTATIKP